MAISKNDEEGGLEALKELKSIDPPLFLAPSPSLSQAARLALPYLYSSLHPFCPKSPFPKLLVKGFDHEQIWKQIDIQSNQLLPNLVRELALFEKNPTEISKGFEGLIKKMGKNSGGSDEEDDESGESDQDMGDAEEIDASLDEDDDIEDDVEEDDNEDDDDEEDEEGVGIEDKFLKMRDMKKYMKDDEAREYGGVKENKRVLRDEEDEDEDDDELGHFGVDGDEDDDEMGNARYEDFFGGKKGESTKRKSDSHEGPEDSDSEDEDDFDKGFEDEGPEDSEDEDDSVKGSEDEQKEGSLSTYEKEQKKQRAKIEEMEKANMETKSWNMLGEVTATRRPKNSALEVDLDFEHNVRPAPIITEEVTQSLEDLIKKRVLEGHFNDVQKAPSLPSTAPKEYKEIDENKNTEGLHKSYENEYMEKTSLVVPESFSDERKKEASLLFQKLCYKLDALSHFHFTPKPIIEDMSIQVNVPALVIEEIAPLVVSDATMLAPEEVFAGKGDIKEEAELTQAERKRRRASKKRKFAGKTKAETAKRMENKKAQDNSIGKEEP